MTERLGSIRLAVLLSVGLHGLGAWWLFQRDMPAQRMTLQPHTEQPRLQLMLVPVAKQPEVLAAAIAPTQLPTREGKNGLSTLMGASSTAGITATGRETAERESVAGVSSAAPGPTPPAAGVEHGLRPRLELNLRAAAQAIELQRRQSPLASVVDAQQMQTGNAKIARAFAKLEPVSSSIVEEKITADGGRVIRFSGGGCMRMPNPSSRSNDDVRKPVMENC